ncbi:uncharacterized protein LOC132312098 [Cornus florida]|uniref:uncharacterized protein LOC132312098 n=1 Tax=Cornus florida TaxID=4283 RepID=UPI00289BD57C|nr:uncharacterized protein LOC132312098 [Cornus florida]
MESSPVTEIRDDTETPIKFGTKIQITALDGIINVNSLFTLAVFVGLTWDPRDINNRLLNDPLCIAGPKVTEDLVSFHVYSFSSFLFSSLIAMALKQAIKLGIMSRYRTLLTFDLAVINQTALRVGYLVSAAGSVSGCVCLMLALVNVVQIKLGTLSCANSHISYGAVVPLVILVPSGLFIYVCSVLYAFTR